MSQSAQLFSPAAIVRREMENLQIEIRDLAGKMGVSHHKLSLHLKNGSLSGKMQKRIEEALGWYAVWSIHEEVQLRMRAFNLIGVDFATTEIQKLAKVCAQKNIPAPKSPRSRGHIEAALRQYLAANPRLGEQTATKKTENKNTV